MTIRLNGSSRDVPPGTTIAEAVEHLTNATEGIAVARNGEIVRRTEWAATALEDGDTIEVVTARQGG